MFRRLRALKAFFELPPPPVWPACQVCYSHFDPSLVPPDGYMPEADVCSPCVRARHEMSQIENTPETRDAAVRMHVIDHVQQAAQRAFAAGWTEEAFGKLAREIVAHEAKVAERHREHVKATGKC